MTRTTLLLILFLGGLSINPTQAQTPGSKKVTGQVVQVSPPIPPGEIHFTLLENTTEERIDFSIFSGQFNINDYRELTDLSLTITYLNSKAPVAIGVNVANANSREINYLVDPATLDNNLKEYHFIGRYIDFTMPNNNIAFSIEGANGRMEEFSLPVGANRESLIRGEFENEEVIVTYILVNERQITAIEAGEPAWEQPTELFFTGTISDYSDSGLGPMYNLELTNKETAERFSSLVYMGLMPKVEGKLIGKKVKVYYVFNQKNYLESVTLKSKYDPSKNDPNQKLLTVEGDFVDCQIGDVDGYLYISAGDDGKTKEFLTGFDCPEGITEGQRVVVKYQVGKEIEITNVELIK